MTICEVLLVMNLQVNALKTQTAKGHSYQLAGEHTRIWQLKKKQKNIYIEIFTPEVDRAQKSELKRE